MLNVEAKQEREFRIPTYIQGKFELIETLQEHMRVAAKQEFELLSTLVLVFPGLNSDFKLFEDLLYLQATLVPSQI